MHVGNQATILIVDDEPDLLKLFTIWLRSDHSVETASTGEEALQKFDDSIDAVLLDRNIPDQPGDQVLRTIRERGYACPVAMNTAVEPDFDIIELGFDEYLTKPVSKEEVRETMGRLLKRATYNEQLREYFALVSKKALLETTKRPSTLAASEDYAVLINNIENCETRLEEILGQFSDEEFKDLFRTIDTDLQTP